MDAFQARKDILSLMFGILQPHTKSKSGLMSHAIPTKFDSSDNRRGSPI